MNEAAEEEKIDWFGVLLEYYFPVVLLLIGGLIVSFGISLVSLPFGIIVFGIATIVASMVGREQHNQYMSVRHNIPSHKRYR